MTDRLTGEQMFEQQVASIDLDNDILTVIAQVVCRRWTIFPEELFGRCGSPYIHFGRHVAWRLAARMTDLDAGQIGQTFGGFRPDTVRPWIKSDAPFKPTEVFLPIITQLEKTAWKLAA